MACDALGQVRVVGPKAKQQRGARGMTRIVLAQSSYIQRCAFNTVIAMVARPLTVRVLRDAQGVRKLVRATFEPATHVTVVDHCHRLP